MPTIRTLFDVSRRARFFLLSFLYAAELVASLWMAYELRFDFVVSAGARHERLLVLLWLIPAELVLLGAFHQLTPLLGYFSTPDLSRIFHALFLSSIIASGVWIFLGEGCAPPRGVIAMNFVFGLVGITGARLALRSLRESATARGERDNHRKRRVAIIGAGDTGAVLAHELSLKPGFGLEPVAFFDDDKRRWHSRVHDIPVMGSPELLRSAHKELDIQGAIIAMPSAPAKRIGEIVKMMRESGIQCKTVPSLDQLAHGHVRVSQLRNVEVQDLLGRERVELETGNIRHALRDRVVVVTGAGGSIGSELCRQIASYEPRLLVLLERSEPSLFQIQQELFASGHEARVAAVVADIADRARVNQVFGQFHPDVVFHAAAHKHVPMMESQPGEAIKNNSLGTAVLADLSLEFGVDRFTLISTDKAVNPTSVMGGTKRLAEMYIQSLNEAFPNRTKFMTVRFGNVLGSSGSVIPVFQKQIAEGGPVKVTHPEMTRYFMTIPEASMLVLQSASQGTGGEIFVLDMGQPVKIADLARQMIELSGLKPDSDIQIEFTGIRPGEKLFEEFTHKGEDYSPTNHPKICRFNCRPTPFEKIRSWFEELRQGVHNSEPDKLKLKIKQLVPDYTPYLAAREAAGAPAEPRAEHRRPAEAGLPL